MAITVWTGSDGILDAAANWSNGLPGAGGAGVDKVVFNGTQSAPVTSNAAAFTSVNLAEVIVEPSYSGNLGDSGTPLEWSATKMSFKGSGMMYFNNGDTFDTNELIIDAPSGTVFIGDNAADNGIPLISLLASRNITLKSTLQSPSELFIGSGVTAKIEGSNTYADVHLAANGTVTSLAQITNLHNHGTWTQLSSGALITNIFVLGGTVKYLSAGTITLAVVHPAAVLDFTGDNRSKTLTTARVFPGGQLVRTSDISPAIGAGGSLRTVQTIS